VGVLAREAMRLLCIAILVMLFVSASALWGEDPGDEWAPRQIYLENCAGCHGFDRMGFVGVPLTPSDLSSLSEAGIRSLIRQGILDTLMPGWSCRLKEEDLRLLSRYLKGVRPESKKEIQVKPDGSFEVVERLSWQKDPQRMERGKLLFSEYCMGCHHPEIEAFAPAYRNVARERDMRVIVGQIKFPYANSKLLGYADQTMPKFDLSDEEIKSLGAYIYHFKTEEK